MLNRNLYCFWVGHNNPVMNENRVNGLESIRRNSGVNVVLVDNNNLDEYILPEEPLHPGFEYLSDVHKADYLRTYFMHNHGGGYTDIKPCSWNWNIYFDELESTDCYGIGAPEDEGELSVTVKQRPWLGKYWPHLISNDLYIFKPKTNFTKMWYSTLLRIMDSKLEKLQQNPAKHPREAADTVHTSYPIEWGEILLEIFHPLCFVNSENIIKTMPYPITINYR
jgi:hypothetical protein